MRRDVTYVNNSKAAYSLKTADKFGIDCHSKRFAADYAVYSKIALTAGKCGHSTHT